MIGITSFGGYIPRLRLSRKLIAQNVAWYSPVIWGAAQGEKAVANWDEDALSMAVAAARTACWTDRTQVTPMPPRRPSVYGRLNADILATALNLSEDGTACADFTGCLKAERRPSLGPGAVSPAKEARPRGGGRRRTKMATNFEMFL